MVSRKRGRQEMEAPEPPKEPTMLERIRSMWEFANLSQWIFTFGRAVKIDENLDIEDLEMECLKTYSTVLPDIGLALLKFVSSHRGLTPEIFDEYTRRQYVAKAPLRNPYGEDEEPVKFNDFDVFTKIRVLQQLTQWTFGNPDRIRERMEEQKDTEQTIWRIEPFGWDSEDRTYIVLDDNRLYRRTDPPPPPPPAVKLKKNSKKGKAAARRASKRRKVSEPVESEAEVDEAVDETDKDNETTEDDGFGGMKWECIAVTLNEFNTFLASIEKSRDPNEKILRKRIADDVLPLLEKQEEARQRKQAQKERELLNLEKLAHAKRSSRIAGKMEQQKQEEETREAERKKHADLLMAKKEQEKWVKLEKERESRMMTREQRLKEREARRILHEEELANLSEDNKKLEAGESRLSERHLKAEIERKKQALEELAEEDDWIFDCICGAYGQIDDGTHSIACDKCNIWQHSKCVGVSEAEADKDDFHFICTTCQRRAKDAERAKTQPPIKIKINRPGSSSSPAPPKQNGGIPAVVLNVNGGSKIEFSPQKQTSHANSSPLGLNGPSLSMWPTQISSPQPYQPLQYHNSPGMYPPHSNGYQSPTQRPYDPSRPTPAPNSYSGPYGYSSNINSHSPTKPVYTGPYAAPPQASSPAPSVNGTPKSTSSHVFSKPQPYSPTSLPPPGMPLVHTNANGSKPMSQVQMSNISSAQNGYIQQDATRAAQYQSSPSALPRTGYGALPSHASNGSRPSTSDGGHRRSSFNQQSPFTGAPVLNPVSKEPVSSYSTPSSSAVISTPGPASISPPAFAHQTPLQKQTDSGHNSALPAVASGYSPIKHSPPRPTSSNGSFSLATPSMLPPVASLSPSPSLQNLTPPVKHSDVERSRPAGQSVGP